MAVRLALITVLLSMTIGLGQAGGVSQPRRPVWVGAWLGQWTIKDDEGELMIHTARYAPTYAGAVDCPCDWYLHGIYEDEDGQHRAAGPVSYGSGGSSWSATWLVDEREQVYGLMRMKRRGDDFTGFIKPCRTCGASKHWKGYKTSDDVPHVGFRFALDGVPAGHPDVHIRAGGSGRVAFRNRRVGDHEVGFLTPQTRVFHVHVGGRRVDIEAGITGKAVYRYDDGDRLIAFDARVATSSDPGCLYGADVGVSLVDGRYGQPDRVRLKFRGDDCELAQEDFASTDPDRVKVVISGVEY